MVSIVGIQCLAIRNNKTAEYEIVVIDNKGEVAKMNDEIQVVHNELPALWTAANGIQLPKKADVSTILRYNVQLRERKLRGFMAYI